MRKVAAAAVVAGEVHQLADGRAGVYQGQNGAAAGDQTAWCTEGQVEITKTTGIVILDGGKVFWDHSANSATFRKVNDRDFYLGTAVGDAASADTTVIVNLNVEPRYLLDIARDPFDTTIVLTAGTPALNRRGGAHVLTFSATAEAQKVDILTKDGFAVGANAIIEGQVEVVDDGDATTIDFNIGVANASHASDADSITESVFIHTDSNAVNILAESDDGTTEVNATDTTIDYVLGTRFEFWIDMRDPADCQIYINGVLILPATVFDVSAATGPFKLLVHLEKGANDETAEYHVDCLKARIAEHQSFTAVRAYVPIYELEELDALQVTVVPKSLETEMADRARDHETYRIDVAVQKRLSEITNAVIDPMTLLAEEVSDYMRRRALTGFPAAHWIGIEQEPIYYPPHLELHSQFTSVITLVYLVTR
eukprot:g5261.t1